jgi:hypothetical protein
MWLGEQVAVKHVLECIMFPAVSSILSAACSWSFDKVPKKWPTRLILGVRMPAILNMLFASMTLHPF